MFNNQMTQQRYTNAKDVPVGVSLVYKAYREQFKDEVDYC